MKILRFCTATISSKPEFCCRAPACFNIDGNVFPSKLQGGCRLYIPGSCSRAKQSFFSERMEFSVLRPDTRHARYKRAKIKNLRFNNLRKYDVDNVLPFRDAPAVFYAIKSAIDCIGEKTPNREYAEGCLFAALSAHNALMRKKKAEPLPTTTFSAR